MTPQVDNAPDDLNLVTGVDIQRSVTSSEGLDPNNQSALTPDRATNETEKLLDTDGLLEMARLVGSIKEDGRLKYIDEEHTDQIDI